MDNTRSLLPMSSDKRATPNLCKNLTRCATEVRKQRRPVQPVHIVNLRERMTNGNICPGLGRQFYLRAQHVPRILTRVAFPVAR